MRSSTRFRKEYQIEIQQWMKNWKYRVTGFLQTKQNDFDQSADNVRKAENPDQ
jgi:hypothetical protein